MAKLPPKKAEENTGEWLNTYADMVTLLLTFFVLLFSCSNMDETKMQYIFQAFQVRGRYVNTVVTKPTESTSDNQSGNSDTSSEKGGEGEQPQSWDEFYQYMSQYIEDQDLGDDVFVEQGMSTITIRFNDKVFFDGDSSFLKPEGRKVLLGAIPGIHAINDYIQSLIVTGHTAYLANPTIDPFGLSAQRAVSVEAFLNANNTVDDSKYAVYGYGPNKPIADNSTADGKRQNRRVEIIIQRKQSDLDMSDPKVLMDMLLHQYNIANQKYNIMGEDPKDPDTLPEGSADKIIATINDQFSGAGTSSGVYGPARSMIKTLSSLKRTRKTPLNK